MKNIFNNIKAYFVNINRYKAATTQESTFVILDTETTGLNVNEGHRIVSIAATKIKNLKITNEILVLILLSFIIRIIIIDFYD